ncbi:hypothetical protein ACTS9D_02800 [Empedobacter brevis]
MRSLKIKYFIFGAIVMFLTLTIPKIYKHYTYFKLSGTHTPEEIVKMMEESDKNK